MYVVEVGLPDVQREDIDVEMNERELVTSGELKETVRKGVPDGGGSDRVVRARRRSADSPRAGRPFASRARGAFAGKIRSLTCSEAKTTLTTRSSRPRIVVTPGEAGA
ncbi:hypothetical protein GCM10009753_79430 [Streptantibioticus ferralitis]